MRKHLWFFDVYLSLVSLPLLWLFLLFLLLDHYTPSLKYWKVWCWEQIFEISRAVFLIGGVVSPSKEWFRGTRQLLGISLIILSDGPCFVCLSLQKSPVKLPLCSLKDVSLCQHTNMDWASNKLTVAMKKKEAEISEESGENIWSMGCCLAGGGRKGLRWWCHEGRDSSRKTLILPNSVVEK